MAICAFDAFVPSLRAAVNRGRSHFQKSPLDPAMAAYQKRLMTRFVLPFLSLVTVIFYVTHWTSTPQTFAMTAFGIAVAVANIWLTQKDRLFQLGSWRFSSRDDIFDCIRWLLNLMVFDALLAWTFQPRPVVFVSVWLVLMAAARAVLFSTRHRVFVVSMGLGVGAVLLAHLAPQISWLELTLVVLCMAGQLTLLGLVERHWTRETFSRAEASQRESSTLRMAELMKRDAALGTQLRMVSHELRNMLTVLDFAIQMNPESISGKSLERVQRAVDYAKRVNVLMLGNPNADGTERTFSVLQLVADIELLVAREVVGDGLTWRCEVAPNAYSVSFKERSGSVYFILHNLIRNAREAVLEAREGGHTCDHVSLSICTRNGNLQFSVIDDAGLLDECTRRALLNGNGTSSKSNGNGLGMRFVHEECRRNGFELCIAVEPGARTEFCVVVPFDCIS